MLQLILQISVLVCSFSNQHEDLPENCHLPTLPKLCAAAFSLQTHLERVVAEHPWFDLKHTHYLFSTYNQNSHSIIIKHNQALFPLRIQLKLKNPTQLKKSRNCGLRYVRKLHGIWVQPAIVLLITNTTYIYYKCSLYLILSNWLRQQFSTSRLRYQGNCNFHTRELSFPGTTFVPWNFRSQHHN